MASRFRSYLASLILVGFVCTAAMSALAQAQVQRPDILVIMGDDIGQTNISAYSFGLVGYKTPNIDRIAHEGMMFTDYYAEVHGGPLLLHYRTNTEAHGVVEGRHSRGSDRTSAP